MKINLPVTQREIDYPESAVFVTKTDTKGIITFANDSFVEIAGYTREELLGENHNIVRHPDMPAWAFQSLWDTVQGGHPWRGIVKNRAKNGDHYWVRATVSPIKENGVVIGYISLRKKPTRAEVAAAEALYKSKSPPSAKRSLYKRFVGLTLQTKLQLLVQPALLVMMGIGSILIINDNRASMFTAAQQRADLIANSIIDNANMLMVTGQASDPNTRKLLVEKIASSGNIVNLRLMRTEEVSKQFGPGLPEEQVQDNVQRNAIASKQPYYAIEEYNGKPVFRAVTPYMAIHNFHGTDCLSCHVVPEGSVNGLSDVRIDLSEHYEKLHKTIIEQVLVQALFQIVLFFFIRLIVQRFVVVPVEEIKQHQSELVSGRMTSLVDISGRDEMGEVLCSVQSTKILLGSIIDQITSVSRHIDDRASHLSQAMTRVSEGSQAQSEAAGNMAQAIEKMTASIDQIARHASDVKEVSENSTRLANEGGKIVQQVVEDMATTNQAVQNTAHTMQELGSQSDRIQDVVKVIREIADQTNLLALNAAIEAARAGEQGRGFAVVADEVRKLAEKTSRSTQEIAEMVDKIRASTSTAITEMEATVQKVSVGTEMASKAGQAIVEINDGVSRVLSGVEDISASIQEQSVASRDIASNVEKVAQMSEENNGAVRNISGDVDELEALARSLEDSIRNFEI